MTAIAQFGATPDISRSGWCAGWWAGEGVFNQDTSHEAGIKNQPLLLRQQRKKAGRRNILRGRIGARGGEGHAWALARERRASAARVSGGVACAARRGYSAAESTQLLVVLMGSFRVGGTEVEIC